MKTIAQVIEANNHYKEEQKRINELYTKLTLISDELDLEEVKTTLNYLEIKDLYNLMLYCFNNKEIESSLHKIMEEKKIKEYPEILGVHYYPIIKDIDSISDEKKIDLDKMIKDAFSKYNVRVKLSKQIEPKILDFLIENKVLSKEYVFHCTCDGEDCYDEFVSQERFNKLKEYWSKESEGIETSHKEDREMDYGYIEIGCWNDGSLEIGCLDDFNTHLRKVRYKVIQKPDMTLDNI